MTELLAFWKNKVLVTLKALASWLILLTLWTLQTLLERTGLLIVDGLMYISLIYFWIIGKHIELYYMLYNMYVNMYKHVL